MPPTARAFETDDLTGSNGGHAALHNRGVVLRAIHRGAPISRTELAERCGLTKPSIARIVEKLLDEGLVVETGRRHGGRGQPAIELEINPSGCFAIGANIDRDHLTVLAVDAVGAVRARVHYEKWFILPDEFIQLMRDAWTGFRRKGAIDPTRLAGIGIAMPSQLGEVPFLGFPESYHAWTKFDVRGALAKLTSAPVFIDNDADAAAAGELQYGLGGETPTFLYMLANACLGGSIVVDGMRYDGEAGLSGEVGWLPTELDGQPTRLGSAFALLVLYDFLRQHGVVVTEPRQLSALDARGRALVSQWLKSAAGAIAEAVRHIGILVDPDAILIGGRFPVRLLDELLLQVHERLEKAGGEHPPIHRAMTSEDAAALGAATIPLAQALMLDVGHV